MSYAPFNVSCLGYNLIKTGGVLLTLLPGIGWGQDLLINEVVSSNQHSAYDEDGDAPDWIELYLAGSSTQALSGIGLSDDPQDPYKWVFAGGSMDPGEHLLVFASDKDRQGASFNWDPVITAGDLWRYTVPTSEPPSSWKSINFNDGSWSTGPTGIGYGDNDDATIIPTSMSVYLRKTFTVIDPDDIPGLMFHIDVDDGYIAYLNGSEFSRRNMGAPGSFKAYNSGADNYTEPSLPYNVHLDPVMLDPDLLVAGINVLAIQVHNSDINSSDLTALPFLTLGISGPPSAALPDYLNYPGATRIHTNFKISSDGEALILTSAAGGQLDSVAVPALPSDVSFGRASDGAPIFNYFILPTPEAANSGGVAQLATPAEPFPPQGFYTSNILFSLAQPGDGTTFRYTVTGQEPGDASPLYLAPLSLAATTVVRVRSTSPDGLSHHQSTFSYFINEDRQLPVMSLVFNPGSFFDNDTGIYVMGPNASAEFPHFGANFWEDWERAIHIEYFEDAQELSFSAPGGVKIFGGWSRGQAQRSLALFARGSYGASDFSFPFFEEREYDDYQALVLRNAGNDWPASGYRDVFMTDLILDRNIEHQAFRPVEVYLNGSYWGIYNLREKVNEHFLASTADLSSDEIDLLELYGLPIHGSGDQYAELVNYVETHTLSADAEFEYIRERVDLNNFIDYQFSQIYFDNQDWPGNNIKFWKSTRSDGRWRWILFDTDFGFGIWNPSAYMANTLDFALAANGPGWPNPPWSTLFLRKFINNAAFKREFVLRATDLLNWNFNTSTVTQKLEQHRDAIAPGIIDHFERWQHNSINHWTWQFSVMETFAEQRPAYMRQFIRNRFGLPAPNTLTVMVDPPGCGIINIHSLRPRDYPWSGIYFPTIPLDVSAIPAAGYSFSHWEGIASENPDLLLNLEASRTLMAVFVENPASEVQMVINEINYHSPDAEDAKDWVELQNYSSVSIDLEGWSFSDSDDDNQFIFPSLSLAPDAYLVLTADSLDFRAIHGPSSRVLGDLGFNFSNGGELIRLFDPLGMLVDSLSYSDLPPWPPEADGLGATLELIHPTLDNGLSQNWAASDGLGTPGAQNSRYANPAALEPRQIPTLLQIGAAFPNPFNGRITIPFSLPHQAVYRVQIYDLRGALVHDTSAFPPASGDVRFRWDGRSSSGSECASGMYLVRISQDQIARTSKIALIR